MDRCLLSSFSTSFLLRGRLVPWADPWEGSRSEHPWGEVKAGLCHLQSLLPAPISVQLVLGMEQKVQRGAWPGYSLLHRASIVVLVCRRVSPLSPPGLGTNVVWLDEKGSVDKAGVKPGPQGHSRCCLAYVREKDFGVLWAEFL